MSNKYNAKKCHVDGYIFDSKKESIYYLHLKSEQQQGNIDGLELQPKIILQPPFKDNEGKHHRAITYTPDFRYIKKGKIVYVDVKGFKTEVYKIKMKLFLYRMVQENQNILFEEV